MFLSMHFYNWLLSVEIHLLQKKMTGAPYSCHVVYASGFICAQVLVRLVFTPGIR